MNSVLKNILPVYIVLFIYLIINVFIRITDLAKVYIFILNPLFLLIISVLVCYLTNGFRIRNRNKYGKSQNVIIIIISYLILYYLSGLIFGFLRNGYSLSLKGIICNFISIFLVVLFKEYIRYRMISTSKKKINLIFTTILFIMLDIEFIYLFNNLNGHLFEYFFKELIPIVLINITSTYLVYRTGAFPNYIYRGLLSGISLFSPIIPNLNWLVNNIVLIILMIIIIFSIDYLVELEDKRKRKLSVKKGNSFSTWCLFFITIIFVLFIVGVFKYQPIAVLSNSMKGYFSKGDAVVIEKINDLSLIEKGDVIYYKHDGRYITHRVVEIEKNNNSYIYYTKGDNNDAADDWKVYGYNVFGVVKFKVKYVGWPSVLLNELLK